MRERIPLLIGLIALAIALCVGMFELADGIRNRGNQNSITVTGSAKRSITSDFIVWDGSVSAQAPTPQEASKQLATWADQIQSFLLDSGTQPDELTIQPVQTNTVNGRGAQANTVVAYQLTRNFEIRSSRVPEISGVIEKTSTLLTKGVPLAAQPPQYIYTRLYALRPVLLAQATKDAKARAESVVRAAGGQLGGLRGVDVGVFQVTAPNSTEVSDYGVYDTSTLQKDVTSVVNITFAVT